MLILTRKVGESINIGDNITITILGVSGQQVRIGINGRPDRPRQTANTLNPAVVSSQPILPRITAG